MTLIYTGPNGQQLPFIPTAIFHEEVRKAGELPADDILPRIDELFHHAVGTGNVDVIDLICDVYSIPLTKNDLCILINHHIDELRSETVFALVDRLDLLNEKTRWLTMLLVAIKENGHPHQYKKVIDKLESLHIEHNQ